MRVYRDFVCGLDVEVSKIERVSETFKKEPIVIDEFGNIYYIEEATIKKNVAEVNTMCSILIIENTVHIVNTLDFGKWFIESLEEGIVEVLEDDTNS